MFKKDILVDDMVCEKSEEKEVKIYSKKKIIIIYAVSIAILTLGFATIILCAILSEYEIINNHDCIIPVISALVAWILDAVFLVCHYKGMLAYSLDKASKNDLSKYLMISEKEYNINEYLESKFKYLESNYYHKRCFSLAKDYVNIFAKKIETVDVESAIDVELEKFDSFEFKHQHKLLMLFVEKRDVTNEDIECITNLSKEALIGETILHQDYSLIVVLRDKNTKKTYYVKPGYYVFTLYHKAYKKLLRMLNYKKKNN